VKYIAMLIWNVILLAAVVYLCSTTHHWVYTLLMLCMLVERDPKEKSQNAGYLVIENGEEIPGGDFD